MTLRLEGTKRSKRKKSRETAPQKAGAVSDLLPLSQVWGVGADVFTEPVPDEGGIT